jgi:BirA family biotin operon repressor/biotin-[acetyl-CoA-carboxylase] ligase
LEGAKRLEFDEIIQGFCEEFNKLYEVYIMTGNLAGMKAEYESFLVNVGRQVSVYEEGQQLIGKALGINDEGELLFEKDSKIRTIRAGEVSVRGIYGYV